MKNFTLKIETTDLVELINLKKIKVTDDFINEIKSSLKPNYEKNNGLNSITFKLSNEDIKNQLKQVILSYSLSLELI